MTKTGMLISGRLGHLSLEHVNSLSTVEFVFTDKRSAGVIQYCKDQDIPIFLGNPRNGRAREFIASYQAEILLSVNYLFVVERDLLNHPERYAINLHGSLLPKYRGRTPHVWAIINNETETGVTAHLMQKVCDAGDVLLQRRVPIKTEDTGASILGKFERIYPQMITEILTRVESNDLKPVKQDESEATYFGQRTPEDGRIDWNWQRERIRNWIRAQARPYPGAFAFHQGKQITIHCARFSTHGFHWSCPNGTIIQSDPLTVKTSNGALVLEDIEPRDRRFLKDTALT